MADIIKHIEANRKKPMLMLVNNNEVYTRGIGMICEKCKEEVTFLARQDYLCEAVCECPSCKNEKEIRMININLN